MDYNPEESSLAEEIRKVDTEFCFLENRHNFLKNEVKALMLKSSPSDDEQMILKDLQKRKLLVKDQIMDKLRRYKKLNLL